MSKVRMDIHTIVVGAGPISSLVVLKPRSASYEPPCNLPIKIGGWEASAIGRGIDLDRSSRPLPHDLLKNTIESLGGKVSSVTIVDVDGPTFFAQINITSESGERIHLDARPSDALALAVRTKAPIYAQKDVLDIAALPDFSEIEAEEERREDEEFRKFINSVNPEDFLEPHTKNE